MLSFLHFSFNFLTWNTLTLISSSSLLLRFSIFTFFSSSPVSSLTFTFPLSSPAFLRTHHHFEAAGAQRTTLLHQREHEGFVASLPSAGGEERAREDGREARNEGDSTSSTMRGQFVSRWRWKPISKQGAGSTPAWRDLRGGVLETHAPSLPPDLPLQCVICAPQFPFSSY